ncbi:hypothetical protein NQ315_009562 [Exocentrus adspersus]|uniref:FYVE-type domain-containing protein n=1 Tax=Exocentrus adspersus TaxID=1586481 RepID=A0AAV8WHV4_9CUCU|nr:hypothetical protein NQ315_009562 [Exocentrus adspersus]
MSAIWHNANMAEYKNGWLIKTASKSFAVYAATAVEKGEWMAHINKCIDDLLRKSGKKAVAEHAAVWVPDGEASVCMHCKKTQFTLINRRHHCRKCGAVVCGPCSNKRFLLPNQSSKPLRVCLHCYEVLTSASTKNHNALESGHKGVNADSSGEEDSDDDEDTNKGQPEAHDLVSYKSFYIEISDRKLNTCRTVYRKNYKGCEQGINTAGC